MRRSIVCALLLAAAAGAHAQNRVAGPPPGTNVDISTYSDEFDSAETLAQWQRFERNFGWPDFLRDLAVDEGVLKLEPYHSAWVRDRIGPFLYRDVVGDFDVRARVRVRGENSDIAGGTWSLGGLMARVPNRNTAENWQPRAENWHFITTGVGHEPGKQMTETKGTYNSYSSLKLRPFPTGWVELRMVRVGMSFVVLARADGEKNWKVRDRFYRMEQNPAMQVGLIAYTTSDDVPPGPENPPVMNTTVEKDAKTDMRLDVDWIRYARPKLRGDNDWYAQVSANPLADVNLSEAEVLKLIGD